MTRFSVPSRWIAVAVRAWVALVPLSCSGERPATREYESFQTITRYLELSADSMTVIRTDTLEKVRRKSHWFNSLRHLRVLGDSCTATFAKTWWDHDYGSRDSTVLKGVFRDGECRGFGEGRYARFEIAVDADTLLAVLRFFSIPYDSLSEPGVRSNMALQIGLDPSWPVPEVRKRLDSALTARGFSGKFHGRDPNPDFFDDGIRVWQGSLYECVSWLRRKVPKPVGFF